jgi:hypothetical protein
MTAIRKYCVIVLIAGAGWGCTPLEQAPLVYSSAEKGGINVSASPAAASMVDVSIGYSLVDAAYVPVAVGKPCAKMFQECENSRLTDVRGTHGTLSTPLTQEQIDKLKTASEEKTKAFDDAKKAFDLVNTKPAPSKPLRDTAKVSDAAVVIAQTKFETAATDLAAAPADATKLQAKADAETALNAAKAKAKTDNDAAAAAETVENTANTAIANAKAILDNAQRQAANAAGDYATALRTGHSEARQEDALSVFGTFNAKMKGEKDAAQLAFGKTFSTGIAAQNVSMGVKAMLVSNCLAKAYALPIENANTKDALITEAVTACLRE